jgi:ATP-dependent Clp protease protease subunit
MSKNISGASRSFWNFRKVLNEDETVKENILTLNGYIAEDSWFDDDVTPKQFKSELASHIGDVTVWINSPGGDCFAASQIYTALKEHKGKITVKIDGIAASAASVIAMSGDMIEMSPTAMIMAHNPAMVLFGGASELEQGIEFLNEVKESIINAYALKTGLSRAKISKLMDAETWMNARSAFDLGFCDRILYTDDSEKQEPFIFDKVAMATNTITAMKHKLKVIIKADVPEVPLEPVEETKTPVEVAVPPPVDGTMCLAQFEKRLELLSHK